MTNKSSEPSLAHMSGEIARLRTYIGKLTSSHSTLLAYVTRLGDDVDTLSREVRSMREAIRPEAEEDEARRQLH